MFGIILKKLRTEKNITQKDLAKYLGVSDRSVGYYETGQRTPPPDIIEKIADYFNVSVDYLLGRTNIRNPYTIKIDTPEKANNFADEILQILIDTGELTKEELQSGKIDAEKKKKLLTKLRKAIEASQVYERQ